MKRRVADDDSSVKKIESNIHDVLIKTGYPLELEIGTILEQEFQPKEDWTVRYNHYYLDPDEHKGREIDIMVDKSWRTKKQIIALPNIIIECKRSLDSAWVFFMRKHSKTASTAWGQYFDIFQLATKNVAGKTLIFDFLQWSFKNLHYFNVDRIAQTYSQVRTDKPKIVETSEIFEAIIQLTKSISYEFESRIGHFNISETDIIFFYLPVIVFDGLLFEANLSEAGLSLKRTDYVLVKSYYKPNFNDMPFEFFIEVMTKRHFTKWLAEIKSVVSKFDEISKDEALLRASVELHKEVPEPHKASVEISKLIIKAKYIAWAYTTN